MSKPIKIVVSGARRSDGDAPTVEDLLSQINDFVSMLSEVEGAILSENSKEIDWRVTRATSNSPLTFELTPTSINHAMNIDRLAGNVIAATANGFQKLQQGDERPLYFTEKVLDRATKVYRRITNGLSRTEVDFSEYKGAPTFQAEPANAHEMLKRIDAVRTPKPLAHKELGQIEGYITKVEIDGFGRPVVWLRLRLDSKVVKCVSASRGLEKIGHIELSDLLKGIRVQAFGTIHYKDLETISSVDVEQVSLFKHDNELPGLDDILEPNFTDGLLAEDYLEALHKDG